MGKRTEITDLIKTTAREYIPDADVLLFGSRARKNESPDSDFDILIITNLKLTPKEKISLKSKIRKALLLSGIRSDILIQNKNEIEKKKRLPGHIIRNILNDAILL
ncbi:MAG: nucleotidyltransferase domain-containing protein [Bacteroidota bacterium]